MFRSILAFALVALAAVAGTADAQTYAYTNPTYIPTAQFGPVTVAAAAAPTTVPMVISSAGEATFRVAGTFTGLAATIEVSESNASTATWTQVSAIQNGSLSVKAISSTGLYRFNASGFAQARLNISAMSTGSVVLTGAVGNGAFNVGIDPVRRATYSAAIRAFAPAASATDFFALTGAAGITITVTRVQCDGIATAIGAAQLALVKRTTANTGGTPSTVTPTAYDVNDATPLATAQTYAANPTTGTLAGNIRVGTIVLTPVATSTIAISPLAFDFGSQMQAQGVALRSATDVVALNGVGASFPAGTALNCQIEWTEE